MLRDLFMAYAGASGMTLIMGFGPRFSIEFAKSHREQGLAVALIAAAMMFIFLALFGPIAAIIHAVALSNRKDRPISKGEREN